MKKIVVFLVICGLLLAGPFSIPHAVTHEVTNVGINININNFVEDFNVHGGISTDGGGGTGGGPAPG